ncbi:ParB/RepB/Spo0J family partition protein [Stenotrophomonas sp. PvP086]|uniref:ParB/RepB/Spo0J family partition protein n=3 Tax=unclassified Stenotrophomonas TaxID=196198 RepID=UPI003D19C2BB
MSKKPAPTGLESALSALDLSSSLHDLPLTAAGAEETPYRVVAVADVYPDPDQPRRTIDEQKLVELAQTIAAQGLIQPIQIRPHPALPGKWMIVAGERRWRATKLNNQPTINAIVDENDDAERRTAIQIVENVQREEVPPMELVDGYTKLARDFGLTATKIAQMVGRSKQVIGEYLAVAEMDPEYRQALAEGRVTGISPLVELWRARTQYPELVRDLIANSTAERPISRSAVRAAIALAQQPPVSTGAPAVAHTQGSGFANDGPQTHGGQGTGGGEGQQLHSGGTPGAAADGGAGVAPNQDIKGPAAGSGEQTATPPGVGKPKAAAVQIVVAEAGKDEEAGILDLSPCPIPGHVFVVAQDGKRTAYPVDMLRMIRRA